MNIVKSYYIINMKILIKDRLPFIWPILIPSIFLYINKITNALDLRYWWAYMIFSSYVFGIGLHAFRQQEGGTLKTFFSIKDSRVEFFIANLLTQMTFSFITTFFYNILASMIFKFNILELTAFSTLLIILSIPLAFLFNNITLIKNAPCSSINALITVLNFTFIFLLQIDNIVNIINPFKYIGDILIINKPYQIIIYIIIAILCIVSGVFSIKKFSLASNERGKL